MSYELWVLSKTFLLKTHNSQLKTNEQLTLERRVAGCPYFACRTRVHRPHIKLKDRQELLGPVARLHVERPLQSARPALARRVRGYRRLSQPLTQCTACRPAHR